MSKGCIVGLIVAGVIIVLVVVGGFICYAKRDALMKIGMSTTINGMKAQLASKPIEGVDTVTFNAVADKFIEKFDAEESLDPVRMQAIGAQMQVLRGGLDNLTAQQVKDFMDALIGYYPDLKELVPPEAPPEDTAAVDTTQPTDSE